MSESWVRAKIRSGDLRKVKFGREVRIFAEELRRLAERKIEVSGTGVFAPNNGRPGKPKLQPVEKTVGVRR